MMVQVCEIYVVSRCISYCSFNTNSSMYTVFSTVIWKCYHAAPAVLPLEPSCCKKRRKSPNQEAGLGNRGHLKVLNGTKLVLNEHE